VLEILQSIRQADMTPMLERIYKSKGGSEVLDTLMKYIYKGMAQSSHGSSSKAISPQATGFSQIGGRNLGSDGGGQAMSVLLSWHEKVRIIENAPFHDLLGHFTDRSVIQLVEIAGPGSIVRVMTDRRTV
jgi:actin related protein 2/3 complex subunit 5